MSLSIDIYTDLHEEALSLMKLSRMLSESGLDLVLVLKMHTQPANQIPTCVHHRFFLCDELCRVHTFQFKPRFPVIPVTVRAV